MSNVMSSRDKSSGSVWRRGFKISIVDRDGRMRLSSCDIGVEIFEPEHKLVTAEPFRSRAELCAL